jgi:hypothetical protein
MSHHANATSSATAEGLVGAALAYAATSPSRALLLALINIPLIAVAINVFLQFVSRGVFSVQDPRPDVMCSSRRTSRYLLLSSTGYPSLALHRRMVRIRYNSSLTAKRR